MNSTRATDNHPPTSAVTSGGTAHVSTAARSSLIDVTAQFMGDPVANPRREPTEQERRKAREPYTPKSLVHERHVSNGMAVSKDRIRARSMAIGEVVEGLTKSRAIHMCSYLRAMGRKGSRRTTGWDMFTVERVE